MNLKVLGFIVAVLSCIAAWLGLYMMNPQSETDKCNEAIVIGDQAYQNSDYIAAQEAYYKAVPCLVTRTKAEQQIANCQEKLKGTCDQDLQKGQTALKNKDYTTAKKHFIAAKVCEKTKNDATNGIKACENALVQDQRDKDCKEHLAKAKEEYNKGNYGNAKTEYEYAVPCGVTKKEAEEGVRNSEAKLAGNTASTTAVSSKTTAQEVPAPSIEAPTPAPKKPSPPPPPPPSPKPLPKPKPVPPPPPPPPPPKNTTSSDTWSVTVNGVDIKMKNVQGGSFNRGENGKYKVTLDGFGIGVYEVTQAQWRAVMGTNPSYFKGCDQCPVEKVTWKDIQEFLKKLNKQTGKNFRLPTEAEWEFAARGGVESKGYKYAGSSDIDEVAWYSDNSGRKTHPVGKKKPNELGLYDMSGNVWERCSDWYDSDYYASSPANNPQGPKTGLPRVLRGGSWNSYSGGCRVADRYSNLLDSRDYSNGFRIASSL